MDIRTIFLTLVVVIFLHCVNARSLHKRAAFYIANETACIVDSIVYYNGDPIPTDDPCEACRCRPPGFACVLRECEVKAGCRAVRKAGHCCPDYVCDATEPQPETTSEIVIPVVPTEVTEISIVSEVSEKTDDTTDFAPLPNEVITENETPAETEKTPTTTTTVEAKPEPPQLVEKPLGDATSLFYIPKEGSDPEVPKPTEGSTTVEPSTTLVEVKPEEVEEAQDEVLLKSGSDTAEELPSTVEILETKPPLSPETTEPSETVKEEIKTDSTVPSEIHDAQSDPKEIDAKPLLKHHSLEELVSPITTQRIPEADTTSEEKSTVIEDKVTEETFKDTTVTEPTKPSTTKPLPVLLNSEIPQAVESSDSTKNVTVFTEKPKEETSADISTKVTEVPTTEAQKLPELKIDVEIPSKEPVEKEISEVTTNVPEAGSTEPRKSAKEDQNESQGTTISQPTNPINVAEPKSDLLNPNGPITGK